MKSIIERGDPKKLKNIIYWLGGKKLPWLNYSDDEVTCFHPQFKLVADNVLSTLGHSANYHWTHHPYSSGVQVVPDFVLVETSTNRWILVVEIKRSRAAVSGMVTCG